MKRLLMSTVIALGFATSAFAMGPAGVTAGTGATGTGSAQTTMPNASGAATVNGPSVNTGATTNGSNTNAGANVSGPSATTGTSASGPAGSMGTGATVNGPTTGAQIQGCQTNGTAAANQTHC